MAEPAVKPASYDDVLAVPEHLVAEILKGVLHTQPRPAPKHALAASALASELFGPFKKGAGGPGGWWILAEPELHLGADVMVPDLAGWRRERMPSLPEAGWFELAPDWVCEILSPSTAKDDRSLKMPLYQQHGVEFIWLIDPAIQVLEAYSATNGRWTLLAILRDSDPVRIPPFEAVEFSLRELWS